MLSCGVIYAYSSSLHPLDHLVVLIKDQGQIPGEVDLSETV